MKIWNDRSRKKKLTNNIELLKMLHILAKIYMVMGLLVSNSRVWRWGKTGERLFIQSSLPVLPGIRIRGPKSDSSRCLSAGMVLLAPAASRRPADPWIPPELMWPAQNLTAGPRDLPAAFVAILAVRTRRLEGDVRSACSSSRANRARYDCGPSAGRVKFECDSDASRVPVQLGASQVKIGWESRVGRAQISRSWGPRAASLPRRTLK
jgi:hypothetical protein